MRTRGTTLPLILAACGWLISGNLMLRLRDLAGGAAGADFCSALLAASCDDALRSPFSSALGFPLAAWGMLYYGLLFLLLIFGGTAVRRGALLLAAGGAGVSLVLAALFAAGRVPLCPLCLALHLLNLVLVVVVWRLNRLPARRRWLGLAAAALVAGLLVQGWQAGGVAGRIRLAYDQLLAEYLAAPRHEIPVNPREVLLGPAAAPVRLVVFSDFECPACQAFVDHAEALRERHGDRLAVVFKHFPLSTACNPAIVVDFHPRACDAARAAEAAHRQGVFWPFHDALFAAGDAADETLSAIAREVGLDLQRFESERRSPEVDSAILLDLQLGAHLAVDGTPAVYLNGRRVRQLNVLALQYLIAQELDAAGGPAP